MCTMAAESGRFVYPTINTMGMYFGPKYETVKGLMSAAACTEQTGFVWRTMNEASDEPFLTLLVARPGHMRNSLLAFLRAIPGVEVVAVVDHPATALEAARQYRPSVLIGDADLSEESLLELLHQLHAELPVLNSVVLVNSLQQQRSFLAAGADDALLKGCLDERLRAAVLKSREWSARAWHG